MTMMIMLLLCRLWFLVICLCLNDENEDVDDVIFGGGGCWRQAVRRFPSHGKRFRVRPWLLVLLAKDRPFSFPPFCFVLFVITFVVIALSLSLFSFRYHQGRCVQGRYARTAARIWHVAVVMVAQSHFGTCGTLGYWELLWRPQPFTATLFRRFVSLSIFPVFTCTCTCTCTCTSWLL